jgi:hypothetical protein
MWVNAHALPLFLTALAMVGVTGSGLLAVLILGRDDDPPPTAGCPVGTWRMTSYVENLPALGGKLTLVGDGPVYEFRADGSGRADYGERTLLEGRTLGEAVETVVTGELTFRYQVSGGDVLEYVGVNSEAEATVDFLGTPVTDTYRPSEYPVRFHCAGDTLAMDNQDEGHLAEFQRIEP